MKFIIYAFLICLTFSCKFKPFDFSGRAVSIVAPDTGSINEVIPITVNFDKGSGIEFKQFSERIDGNHITVNVELTQIAPDGTQELIGATEIYKFTPIDTGEYHFHFLHRIDDGVSEYISTTVTVN